MPSTLTTKLIEDGPSKWLVVAVVDWAHGARVAFERSAFAFVPNPR
jgi:hypothetical protein